MAKKHPPFKTEAQEAEWWSKNQNLIADRFEQTKAAGKLGKGTVCVRILWMSAIENTMLNDLSSCSRTTRSSKTKSLPRTATLADSARS